MAPYYRHRTLNHHNYRRRGSRDYKALPNVSPTPLLPSSLIFQRTFLKEVATKGVNGHNDRKITDLQLIDRFRSQIFIGYDFGLFDVLSKIRARPAHGQKVNRTIFFNSLFNLRAAASLTNHSLETTLKKKGSVRIQTRGRGWPD